MEIELKLWDSAEFLRNEDELASYLAVVLQDEDDDGPTIYAATVRTAATARGGIATLARESGIPEEEIEAATHSSEDAALPILQKLSAAYAKLSERRLVA